MKSRRDHEEFSQSEKETLPDGQASSLKPVTNRPSLHTIVNFVAIDPIHAAATMNKKRGLAGRFTANLRVST